MRLPLLLLALCLISCDSMTDEGMPNAPANPIVFSSLAIGQQSWYVRFYGEDYRDPNNLAFEYTPDTLVVEVVQATEDGYVFIEYLRPGSTALEENETFYMPDSTQYLVRIANDQLQVFGIDQTYHNSNLFMSYREPLPLAPIQENKAEIRGWKTSLSNSESYRKGYIIDYRLFDRTYPRLNVIIDDTDMQVDGPGKTFLYAKEAGIVRSSSASAWTSQGWGWDHLSPN